MVTILLIVSSAYLSSSQALQVSQPNDTGINGDALGNDWIIDYGVEIVNQTIHLTGNLRISSSDPVLFQNTELILDGSIFITNGQNSQFINNTINTSSTYGIFLANTTGSVLTNNSIAGPNFGIYIGHNNSNMVISSNNISAMNYAVYAVPNFGSNNLIIKNEISSPVLGLPSINIISPVFLKRLLINDTITVQIKNYVNAFYRWDDQSYASINDGDQITVPDQNFTKLVFKLETTNNNSVISHLKTSIVPELDNPHITADDRLVVLDSGDITFNIQDSNTFSLDIYLNQSLIYNATNLNSGTFNYAFENITYGLYNLTITVEDIYGNSNTTMYEFFMLRADDDFDGDGLKNKEELDAGTDIFVKDTDADGIPDGYEYNNGLNPLSYDADQDLDGDGLSNIDEFKKKTNANRVDSDGDGMNDAWEIRYKLDPTKNDASNDPDLDSLINIDEYKHHTDPRKKDTDGDGDNDGFEVSWGSDPLNPNSSVSKFTPYIAIGLTIIVIFIVGYLRYRDNLKE